MITEDYVSFETAKLLKEKGFPQDPYICNTAYTLRGKLSNNAKSFAHNAELFNKLNIKPRVYTIAPTQQMAMKWLREVHNISIEPLVDFGSGEGYWWTADIGYIKKDGLVTELCGYDSYEDAVEAAIKYCLEHLI